MWKMGRVMHYHDWLNLLCIEKFQTDTYVMQNMKLPREFVYTDICIDKKIVECQSRNGKFVTS